jgi:hypothetical protein
MHSVLSSASIKGTLTAAIEVRMTLHVMYTRTQLDRYPLHLSVSFVGRNLSVFFAGKARACTIFVDLGTE